MANPAVPAEIIHKLNEILGEHCHGFIFAAMVNGHPADDSDQPRFVYQWDGGAVMAEGLTRKLLRRLDDDDRQEMLEEIWGGQDLDEGTEGADA